MPHILVSQTVYVKDLADVCYSILLDYVFGYLLQGNKVGILPWCRLKMQLGHAVVPKSSKSVEGPAV